MTLPKIINDLQLIIHNGHVPDDSKFDDRQLIYWVNTQRALWLTNEYNKKREIRGNETQTLKDVSMSIVDANEVTTTLSGTKILKSDKEIPRTLNGQYRDMLLNITPLDFTHIPFNFIGVHQVPYCDEGILNSNMLYFFKHNEYLYCKFGKMTKKLPILKKVSVTGVFEDPLQVDEFNETYDNIVTGIDNYPISAKFLDYIKAEIIKLDVSTFLQMPIDMNNNDENE